MTARIWLSLLLLFGSGDAVAATQAESHDKPMPVLAIVFAVLAGIAVVIAWRCATRRRSPRSRRRRIFY